MSSSKWSKPSVFTKLIASFFSCKIKLILEFCYFSFKIGCQILNIKDIRSLQMTKKMKFVSIFFIYIYNTSRTRLPTSNQPWRMDAIPTPIPSRNLAVIRSYGCGETAMATAPMKKKKSAIKIVFFLPKLPLKNPPIAASKIAPKTQVLTINSCRTRS